MNVVLEASSRMGAREIDFATGNEKAAVDEFDDAVREIAGEVRSIVGGAVFAEAARDEDLGEAIGQGELDVGIGFVVAEKDVEARLSLLDEVVFKCERFVLVGDKDVVDVDGLAHEGARLGVGLGSFKKIRANARTEVLGLADVNDFSVDVLI